MKRFIVRIALTLIVAQWGYAELAIVAPSLKSHLDLVTSKIAIPTHNQWGEYYKSFEEKRLALIEQWHTTLGADKPATLNSDLLTRFGLE